MSVLSYAIRPLSSRETEALDLRGITCRPMGGRRTCDESPTFELEYESPQGCARTIAVSKRVLCARHAEESRARYSVLCAPVPA